MTSELSPASTLSNEKTLDEILAAHGTPKQGIGCGQCDDWGTVVISRGRTTYEVVCPAEDCEAAKKARAAQDQRGAEHG